MVEGAGEVVEGATEKANLLFIDQCASKEDQVVFQSTLASFLRRPYDSPHSRTARLF